MSKNRWEISQTIDGKLQKIENKFSLKASKSKIFIGVDTLWPQKSLRVDLVLIQSIQVSIRHAAILTASKGYFSNEFCDEHGPRLFEFQFFFKGNFRSKSEAMA